MKIALDYDKTYTLDKVFWNQFVDLCNAYGHDVRIVTARSPKNDFLPKKRLPPLLDKDVIYCDGVAKRFHCHWFADGGKGWDPDVWIDDKPQGIDKNSSATREILDVWRSTEEYSE